MNNKTRLIIFVCVLSFSLRSFNAESQVIVSDLPPITIYDEGNLLKLSIEDAEKYHGYICPCLVIGFRTIQLAIRELWKDTIPKREDFKIINKYPGYGLQDAFEYITRSKTRNDFILEFQDGTDISEENLVFIIIRKPTSQFIKINLREEVIPGGADKFYKLKKMVLSEQISTDEQKMEFESAKNEFKNRLMSWDTDKIFEFETGKYYE